MQDKLDQQLIGLIYSFLSFDHLSLSFLELLSSQSSNENELPNSIKNARKLYRSCVDEDQIEHDGISPIISLINKELGGWPILQGSKWNSSSFDLYRSLTQLNRHLFFSISTSIDDKNSSRHVISVRDLSSLNSILLIKKHKSIR